MLLRSASMALLVASCIATAQSLAEVPARRGPAFLDNAVIYQIWMRSFTPEGTLGAAAKKLPHIAGLGANVVYLSPINLQSKAGGYSNPYRIQDYYKIDPEYGSEADLKVFVERAHELGLKVMMDVVYYHTAPDSVMMQTPEYYMKDKNGGILLGNWRLPRPDFANAKLRQYLIDNMIYWVKIANVDGYRCDVSYGVPVDFWDDARAALDKIKADLVLLAESEKPDEMVKAFDISYNFAHQAALRSVFRMGETATRIQAQWEKAQARFPRGTRFIRAADNHDQPRAVVEFSAPGARAAAVINLTFDGIPFLYNGAEVEDTAGTDHQSHYPIRWEYDKPEGMTGSGLSRPQKATIAWYKSLIALRQAQPALATGELTWLNTNRPDDVIAYVREKGADKILVIVNTSNKKCSGAVRVVDRVSAPLFAGPATPARGPNAQKDSVSADGSFQLGPFGYVVAKLQ